MDERAKTNVEKAEEKPELHLMPGKGINTNMVAQMLKSLTGKDMTAEERTKMDAEFAEFHAKRDAAKQGVNKSNLRT